MQRRRFVVLVPALVAAAAAAWAQGVSEQPLPPPGGAPQVRSSLGPRPLPVVRPPAHAERHPVAHPRHVPRKPVPPGVKTGAKTGAKTAVRPPAPAKPAAEVLPPTPPPKIDPNKGTSTGLPLPRWVSFRSDEVNLRAGPGLQYPIDWVYHRRDYPVQVLREFEVWRLVQLQDGTKGWVHQATITGRRGFIVLGGAEGGEQVLRASAADTADPVARLEPGVIGLVKRCPAGSVWCEVQAGGYGGWLKRDALYGVSPDETIP